MGNHSVKTYLKIINLTTLYFDITTVNRVDNFDFYDSRPDRNFQGLRIYPNTSVINLEEVNSRAKHCPFQMLLNFEDGSQDYFRIRQKAAIGDTAGFQHFTKAHEISYHVDTVTTTLEITIRHTEEQLNNQLAESLNKKGEANLSQKNYKAALDNFKSARKKANQSKTIFKIEQNLKKTEKALNAQKLFEEGKKLAEEKKYEEALKKLEESLKLVEDYSEFRKIDKVHSAILKEKKENEKAAILNKEGEHAMKLEDYKTAIKKFEDGLLLAHTDSLIKAIQKNMFLNYNAYAKALYEEGWILEEDENEDRSTDAKEKFEEAKKMFLMCNNIDFAKVVDTKIRGNTIFNEALYFEIQAIALIQIKEFKNGQIYFQIALYKYKKVLEIFKEALNFDQKFQSSVQFVEEQIEDLKEKIENAKIEELDLNMKELTVDTEPEIIPIINEEENKPEFILSA